MRRVRELAGRLTLAAVLAAFSSASWADSDLTPEMALAYTRASDLHFSPDASKLAYMVNSYRFDAKPRIRIVDMKTVPESGSGGS